MDDLLEQLLLERHQQVMAQFEVVRDRLHSVNEKLDLQNGRVRKLELDVAVMQSQTFPAGKLLAAVGTMAAAGLTYWASR